MKRPTIRIPIVLTLGLGLTLALLWLLSGPGARLPAARAANLSRPAAAPGDVFCVTPQGGSYAGCTQVFTNVQAAADATVGGEVIKIAAGTYTDVHVRPRSDVTTTGVVKQVVYVSETVTIQGGYTTTNWTTPYPITQPTTLDAQGEGRVLYVVGWISPTIEDLRIVNGNALGLGGTPGGSDAGGGIYVMAMGGTFKDCWVADNTAMYGGGAYLYYTPAAFADNDFAANYAQYGGGLFLEQSAATLNNNTFINNVADEGGGLALYQSDARLDSNTVVDNAAYSGGGLSLQSSPATLTHNAIIANTAHNGGGLAMYASNSVLDGNLIRANTASEGGGLSLHYLSDALLINTIIAENEPDGLAVQDSSPRLIHNTLAYNGRQFGGGGILVVSEPYAGPSTVALTNTILFSHQVGIYANSGNTVTLEVTLWGNVTDWLGSGTILTGTNNYWGPAGFMDASNGEYHIGPASTAINRGVTTTLDYDVDSETRPQAALPDLGADEASDLSIVKSAPLKVEPGSATTYTLTVANNTAFSLTNLVITDSIPAGAIYRNGGTRVGNVVSWTAPLLASYTATQVTYVVTSYTNLANDDYRIGASGGYSATGRVTAFTLINSRHCWVRLNDSPTVYGTIQAAVDASTHPTDVVKIAGTCTMPDSPGQQQVVYLNKTLILRGGYTTTNWTTPDPAANPTTIDARKRGRCMYINGNAPTVEGLRLINGTSIGLGGYLIGSQTYDAGGGVYADHANATFNNNQIVHNYGNYGGGMFLNYGVPSFNENVFVGNYAGYGGGLFSNHSGAILDGNRIASNYASDGGGIYVPYQGAYPLLRGNAIVNNIARSYGGGVYLDLSGPTFEDNTLSGNRADYGGGIYGGGSGTFSRNLITANHARRGGGVYLDAGVGTDTFNRNRIVGNVAEEYGGGAYICDRANFLNNLIAENHSNGQGSGVSLDGASEFRCNTIAQNSGNSGIYVGFAANPLLINTIIASHTTGLVVGFGNSLATLNSTLWYGNGTDWSGPVAHTNDYSGDPAFLNPAAGDYHIGLNSAALDRGVTTSTYEDMDGHPRPQGLGYDIGADETGVVVFKQVTPPVAEIGAPLTYTIHITNTTHLTLTALITDVLPTHAAPGGVLTWTAQITAPSGVWVRTVPVTVAMDHQGPLVNRVQVTTAEGAAGVYTHTFIPDLTVSKQVYPTQVQAGARLTYTIRVTNTGDFVLHAVVTDTLPTHVTPTGILTQTAVITAPGGVWVWSVPVAAAWSYSGTLSNVVEVATQEGAAGVYTATSQARVTPALQVSKQAVPDPVQAGAQLTYTIRITNTGNTDLHAAITDTLPAQVAPTGIQTWTAVITAPGGVWVQAVPVTVNWSYSGTLTNRVDVATQEGATGAYSATSQAQVTPALAVTKQAVPDPVQAGEQLTYTLHVTNTGNVDLHATISDILPSHVTPGDVLTWTQIITAPGGVWAQTVPVTVEMGYAGPLTNVVQVTTDEGASGIYTETTQAQVTPRLEVTKHANPTAHAGEQLTYTIYITNTGNVDLHATISDILPSHVTPGDVLTWTQIITAPGGVWAQTVPVTVEMGYAGPLTNVVQVTTEEGATGIYTTTSQAQVTPRLEVTKRANPTVQAGEQLTYTIYITNTGNVDLHATISDILPSHVTPGGVLTWTQIITAPGGVWAQTVPVTVEMGYAGPLTNIVQVTTEEGATGIYTTTSQAQVTPRLEVTKQANPTVQAGAPLTYTLRVTNTGNIDLHATITDTLPAHVTPGGVLTWMPVTIAPGNVWTQPVVVTVEMGYAGLLTNVVQVTTDEGATGIYTTTTQAQVTPKLEVTQQANPTVQAGAPLTYTLRVTNTGNIDLHATITDTLPAHVTPGGILTWTPVTITPGNVWTQPVVVTPEMGYAGPLTNVVQVTTEEGASGIYTTTTQAQVTPKLEVTKHADPTVQAGTQLTYTLRVTNTGNVDLLAIITDTLPSHVTPTGILTWTATVPISGVWTQQVVVTVGLGYAGPLTNIVQATTEEGAAGIYTATSQVTSPPTPVPDLQVTQWANPNPVHPGALLTYTLRVTNTGNVDLHATITDTLPSHVTPTGVLTWTATIPMSGVWTQQVIVTVGLGYAGPLTNTVQVTTDEGAMGMDSVTVNVVWRKIYLPLVFRNP